MTDFAGDTLMYVINFANGNGWKIISADTRTPSILA
ncbi:MAG: Spi family protease inhibitor [Bacteroidales bacterium]|nr:Spi family protease inhibitor [Bacteroidales bacterium]